jgi:hypothetical protein
MRMDDETAGGTAAASAHREATLQAATHAAPGWLTGAFLPFIGGYVIVLAWFRFVDVYHTHFSAAGILLFGNTIFRILFIFYLIWIIVGAGTFLIKAGKWQAIGPYDTAELLTLTFFAGAGLLQIAILAIGYASLLNSTTVTLLTLPLVAFSFPRAGVAAGLLRDAFHAGKKLRSRYALIGCCLVGLAWFALLLVKGLYPGGSQDYYDHYFPAYRAFVEHGSLWPNELWFGYFYIKGAGLFFLGILLTDPLAPQAVIFCTCSVAGLVVFLFAHRLAPATAWPVAGVLLFFAILIYTPGWAEFGKVHEFNTIFVTGILWMASGLLSANSIQVRTWITALGATQVAAILANLPIGAFLAILFVAIALIRLCTGDRRGCLICLAQAGVATALVALIMLVNYVTVGLPSDLGLPHTANFADVEKLYRWGVLPMLILMTRLYSYTGVPISKSLDFLQYVLRGNLLWPMVLGGVLTALVAWLGRSVPQSMRNSSALRLRIARTLEPAAVQVLAAALLAVAVLTVTEGRGISSAYYRFTTFTPPIVILAGIAMWTAPVRVAASSRLAALIRHPGAPVPVLALCAAAVIHATHVERAIVPLFGNALKHALGMLSIDAAFQRQSSGMHLTAGHSAAYPNLNPAAGTNPGARGAYAVVGPGTPIWSLHRTVYCMLPDCKIMTYPYFVMTSAFDRILWGSPEEARSLLRSAGIDYFLFSREPFLYGPLPLSPLFSPDHIGNYLGVRWTDGITTLLTWSGPDTSPLEAAWIDEYRRSIARSPDLRRFPDAELHAIFARLNATPHPWHGMALPLLGQKSADEK